jgi:ketosteroid isomerase-like protein
MSHSQDDTIRGLYEAFGRRDLPAVLAMLHEDIEWHAPENLPHGGDFRGREAVGRFFQGIGEHWETLDVDLDALVSGGDRVVALAHAHGQLRATGEQFEYSAAHAWTLRGDTPVRFDEYVNAPVSLPAAHPVAR